MKELFCKISNDEYKKINNYVKNYNITKTCFIKKAVEYYLNHLEFMDLNTSKLDEIVRTIELEIDNWSNKINEPEINSSFFEEVD